jgi:signal transduction histidine kinase
VRARSLRSSLDLPSLDVVLALVLLVSWLGAILTREVVEGSRLVTVPVAVGCCVAVAIRSRVPLPAALALAIAELVQALAGDQSPSTIMALVATLVLAYSVAAGCEEGAASLGLAAVLGSNLLQEWRDHGTDYAFVTIEIGGAWLLGRAARHWRTRATHAEQHQRDLARLAVAEERARIARELHDVVAHGLSVIAVQADAAEAALEREPERAVAPMRAIRSSARNALVDMRQLLHVLRTEHDEDARDPAHRLSDLDELVAGMRHSGLPVEADIRVSGGVPAGLELAAFRIAQEGLTNARKHAGAVPTRLLVHADDREVRVEVRNGPPAGDAPTPDLALSTGHGLLGVRERVLAAGGAVDAGPTPDGGFALVARMPVGEVAR